MTLGRTEYHQVWLTPFGSKKTGCLVLATSSLEVREQAHILPRPSCLEGHGDQGRSAMPEDRQMICSSSKRDKTTSQRSAVWTDSVWALEKSWSPFETLFWACGGEENYWK